MAMRRIADANILPLSLVLAPEETGEGRQGEKTVDSLAAGGGWLDRT
jgi:hypothetical protein